MRYLLCCLLLCAVCVLPAEERLSQEQTSILKNAKNALAEERAQEAISILERWKGKPHATQLLLKGHAHYHLQQWQQAAHHYKLCLQKQPTLRNAALSLIDCCYRLEQWEALKKLLLQWAPAQTCSLDLLKLSIQCADALQDARWKVLLIQVGVVRFADDSNLRLMDIESLIEQKQWAQAKVAITLALGQVEKQTKFWQLLAFVCQQNNEPIDALAAYEAALILDPQNKQLQAEHAQAQLAAGHTTEAFKQFQQLMQQQADHKAGHKTITMAVQSAHAAGELKQASEWLKLIPVEQQDAGLRSLLLRIEQRLLNKHAFNDKVDVLLAKKAIDAQNCLWLGYLAEQQQELGRAEMFYQLAREQASTDQAKASQMAHLYLARLWFGQKRSSEAIAILEQHLKAYPDDWQARRLLQLMRE